MHHLSVERQSSGTLLTDRRGSERFPINFDTTCDFVSPVLEDFAVSRIQNISMTGIGLVTREPVAPGMLMVVVLRNKKFNSSVTTLVRVVHATEQAGGGYLVGGDFERPLTYDEFAKFVM